MSKKSHLEIKFQKLWTSLYPAITFETEAKLIPKRKFRHDFVFHDAKVAIEIQGGIWMKGAHSSSKGIIRDYTKSLLALKEGYSTIHLSSNMITKENMIHIHDIIMERLGINSPF